MRADLAGTTIADAPTTLVGGNPRPLTGTFAAPANAVAGQRYSLVIASQPGDVLILAGA